MRNSLCLLVLLLMGSSTAQLLDSKATAALPHSDTIPVLVFYENAAPAASIAAYRPKHVYSLFNGFSADLTPAEIAALFDDPSVKAVYYDRNYSVADYNYSVQLATSVDTVGARYAHESLNITGRNITVAVIDTGINYSHPDLGGCLGAGCRVRGGYDFYDNDNDPNDEHGHGTHCAGIIGANGTLIGVAPEVQFLAYKVCNPAGSVCTDSAIIASIDHALANGADIISMSLGGKILPNDGSGATEFIIDQAVNLGVVAVSVAGNSGPGQSCIQAPGMSKKIITVGGSYDSDTPNIADDGMMSMSCRGPSAFGRLDPEIVAPGQGIVSLALGSGTAPNTGTSMSAPHVSGAAALLLEHNNTLTPVQVRSLLMHSASNFSGHVFDRGAGLLNISRAILQTVGVTVNGDDRIELSIIPGFNASVNLTLYNNGNSTVSFNFSFESATDLKNLNSINASNFALPSDVSVSPGSNLTVKVNISIPLGTSPATYGSTLTAVSNDSQQLRVPIILTVPIFGSGMANGTLSNAGSYETGSNSQTGDTIYYQLRSVNGSVLSVLLNWSGSGNDLDLYLFTSGGIIINSSTVGASEGESLTLSRLDYDTYWIAVHAFMLTGTLAYNLTVSYTSNVSVSPPYWDGIVGSSSNISFTVSNDAFPKNVSVDVVREVPDSSALYNVSVSMPVAPDADNYYCSIVWLKSDLNFTLNDTRYLDVNLTWYSAGNLDLYLWSWNDTGDQVFQSAESVATMYSSNHANHQLNGTWESISRADILYYSRRYYDLGITVCNRDTNQSYNGTYTVNATLYNVSHWSPASLSLNRLNLSANQSLNVTVSLNISLSSDGESYEASFVIDGYASIPLRMTYDASPPGTPTLNSLQLEVNNDTPAYSWNYSGEQVNYFEIQVSNFSNFSAFPANHGFTNQTNQTSFTSSLLYDGLYFWRVRAVDYAYNAGNWSASGNFTVKTVFLNEFSPTVEWVELYNIMSKNYSLMNWTLGDLDENYTLFETAAGAGYTILYGNITSLTLSDSNGSLYLWNPNGLLLDNVSYSNLSSNYSFGRSSDGGGSWLSFSSDDSTPGAANSQTVSIGMVFGWNLISLPLTA
ncbi:MAG: S8 family serine peptidase [Candidatus Altiarchaeota archaeon]